MAVVAYNEKVAQKLTQSQWLMFMERAFPELKRDYESLQDSLRQHEWENVRKLAHKLRGIVELLGMDDLLDDLLFIAQLDREKLTSVTYQSAFKERYSAYLSEWESSWLALLATD